MFMLVNKTPHISYANDVEMWVLKAKQTQIFYCLKVLMILFNYFYEDLFFDSLFFPFSSKMQWEFKQISVWRVVVKCTKEREC